MYLFFIAFFLIYGGAHLYLFAKIMAAFKLGTGSKISLAAFFLMMVFTPFIVRIAERHHFDLLASSMAHLGYVWMGLIFIFFVSSLLLDIYHLIVFAGTYISHEIFPRMALSSLSVFLIPALISVSINSYGYFEAKNIRIEKISIESPKISEQLGKIRIVQISDVHIGLIVREGRLKKIVDEIEMLDPDILVSTGDLVDGQINNLTVPITLLRGIEPRYGKFAITGNHEFFAGIDQSVDFLNKAGFTVIRDQGLNVAGRINIVGTDDPAGSRFGIVRSISEKALLSKFKQDYFTLLLKHQPVVDMDSVGLFDLQLSGHTHKGQIFPFSLITRLFYPTYTGYYRLSDSSHLYVSRGTGTWGPPVRFLSSPEVTVIDLLPGKS